MRRYKVVKNAGWIIAGKLVNKLLAFIVGVFSARYLGPSNYGLINYAAAYITFFSAICTLGFNSIIVKDFVSKPKEQGTTVGTAIAFRIIASIISGIMVIGIVSIVDKNEPFTILIVALSSLSMIFQAFETLTYWFQSRLESKVATIASSIAYLAVSLYKIYLLIRAVSVVWFALATSVEWIITAAILIGAYRYKKGPEWKFCFDKGKELLSESGSFIVAGLMVSIYASTDRLMLKHMMIDAAVGNYSLAVSLSTAWGFVISAVIDSMSPGLFGMYDVDKRNFTKRNTQLYAIVFYGSITVSCIICLFAPFLINVLYGKAYAGAITPLRIVCWFTAFSYLGVARNIWVVCEKQQRYLMYLYFLSAVINVLLNWFLIPCFGEAGAALASLVTQIATALVFPAFIKSLRPNARLMLDAILLKNVF